LLNDCLKILDSHNIDMTGISSRPPKIQGNKKLVHINIDFNGNFEQDNVAAAMWRLTQISEGVTKVGSREVPWFPLHITDFDNIGKRILSEGDGIQESDHPGFKDPEYRARRDEINLISTNNEIMKPIATVDYNDREKEVWGICYEKLTKLFKTNACEEFNWTINDFQKNIGLCRDEVPQLETISAYLKERTGWRLKPVGGLLT